MRCARAIHNHALHVFAVRDSFIASGFPEVTSYEHSIEVPRGCGVEFPMAFTYSAREFRYPKSGWWVVAYTKFAAKVAAFLLVEVHNSYGLWCFSSQMIRNIRQPDLVRVSGSRAIADQVEHQLRVTEQTNFGTLPDDSSRRGEGRSLEPGLHERGANYLFYNTHNEREISFNEE